MILKETILFPEGGGQPCDFGLINGRPVKNVVRKGSEAVHFIEGAEAFKIGQVAKQELDWSRRLDHMQQHSGQHLITALFDQKFGFDTKSWWLGTDYSYIELGGNVSITNDHLTQVEKMANNLIVEGRAVTVTVTSFEQGLKIEDARSPRGLPADHVGDVRVVSIEGIESNMCCGTHVTNLSQLQAIKLLHFEKAKNKILIHFLVGNRVIRKLDQCYKREQELNGILKGGPPTHIDLVQKVQSSFKNTSKNFQKVLKDLAVFEAEKLKSLNPLPNFYSLHRKDGIEVDFINTFLRNAPQEGVFYFLTVGESSGKAGHMVLRGDPELVKKLGDRFVEVLEGKGNGKGNNYQAKVNNLTKLSLCEEELKKCFD